MKAIDLAGFIKATQTVYLTNEGTTDEDSMFQHPVGWFENDVVVIDPNKTPHQVSPKYCATYVGATKLQAVLATERGIHCTVVKRFIADLGGSFSYNKEVNFLLFGMDVTYNAGLLLDYFTHGYPARLALNKLILDLREFMFERGVGLPPNVDIIMKQTIKE